MDIDKALRNIKMLSTHFPKVEVSAIRENRETAIPILLDYLKAPVEDISIDEYCFEGHLFAMYLLAEFKEHKALKYLLKYLELDEFEVDQLLYDAITEDFGAVIASVAHKSDILLLKSYVENDNLNIYNRMASLSALSVLYVEGVYDQDEFFEYLERILVKYKDDIEMTTQLIVEALDVYAENTFSIIRDCFTIGC